MSISVKALSVGYGSRMILANVEFDAQAGQVTAIVGPNGSGKSTLLRSICGDLDFTGSIQLNEQDISELPPWKLAAMRGVLPQSSSLSFSFTALEVVRIGLTAGIGGDIRGREASALDRVGLSGFENRYYHELSGGEQQRVQLARVLAQVWNPCTAEGPSWLILDEPVANLDIAHQLKIMELARSYALDGGGVMAVMHDLNLTGLFADRVIVLSQARILAVGAPAEVFTDEILSEAYGCTVRVNTVPDNELPFILPQAAAAELS